MRQGRTSRFCESVYRILLLAYPRKHREGYGLDMAEMFRDGFREECGRGVGWISLWSYLARIVFDLALSGLSLRAAQCRKLAQSIQDPILGAIHPKGGKAMSGNFWGDFRQGLRGILRNPVFSSVAVITLALGIGANSAIFSVIHAVLLRPLPFENPEQLVALWEKNPIKGWTQAQAAPANFLDWRRQAASFQGLAAYNLGGRVTMTGLGEPIELDYAEATGNFFSLLGVRPIHGRVFRDEETWITSDSGVLLSYGSWLNAFGGDPDAVGRRLVLNGEAVDVIGVLPPEFRILGQEPDLWSPTQWDPAVIGVEVWTRRAHWLTPIGRLKPDVSLEQATAELEAIMKRLEESYPGTNTQMGAGMTPLHEWIVGDSRLALWVLMGAVGAVLLIACANVANLLLARGAVRQQELAIRGALGAGRKRLAWQLICESFSLALCGGIAGVALAWGAVAYLRSFGPAQIPRLWDLQVDAEVLLFTLIVTLATTLVFGLAPAWSHSRSPIGLVLGRRGRQGALGATAMRRFLIAAEVALSFMLVVASGLLIRSLLELRQVEAGFDPDRVLTLGLSLSGRKYSEPAGAQFYEDLVERAGSLPGALSAAATTGLPLARGTWSSDATIENQEGYVPEFRHRTITPGYLETMGVRLLEGRDFDGGDGSDAPAVVLINQTLARRFESGSPVGSRIKMSKPDLEAPWLTVVGVVADEKYGSLEMAPPPIIYQPLRQRPNLFLSLVVRTQGDPMSLAGALRSEVHTLDPELAASDLRSMDQILDDSLAGERFTMGLVTVFAGLALVLAAVGIYGVTSYVVSRRTQEFGIRMALGARLQDVLRMVLKQGMATVAVGLAIGLLGAFLLTRWISGLLFGVSSHDPLTFAIVIASLSLVALSACYLPARRAALIDPQEALRIE